MTIKDEFLKRLEIVGYEAELLIANNEVRFYSCEIEDGASTVVIEAEPERDEWVCQGDVGTVSLRKGVNTFTIRVLEDQALIMEYKISIVLKKSYTSVKLRALEVNGNLSEPVIRDGEIIHYYYQCTAEVEQIFIEAFPETADMEMEGDIGNQEIQSGTNRFVIIVKSGDGKEQKNYQLLVDRDDADQPEVLQENSVEDFDSALVQEETAEELQLETLMVLGISREIQDNEHEILFALEQGSVDFDGLKHPKMEDGSYCNIPLFPPFSPETEVYKAQVDHDLAAVFIAAYPLNTKDLVTGDVGYQKLENGINNFTILVMGECGSQQYSLEVNRQKAEEKHLMESLAQEIEEEIQESEARLLSLTISGATLEPEFSPDIMDYRAIPDTDLELIHISAVPMSDRCNIYGDLGEKQILQGENTFTINTAAGNKQESKAYSILCDIGETQKGINQEKTKGKGKVKRKKARKVSSWALKLKMLKKRTTGEVVNDKKVIRTTKLIHRLIVIIVFMCSMAYLVNTFLLTTVRDLYQSKQSAYSAINQKRRDVEKHLKNKDAIIQTIDTYLQEQMAWAQVYPELPSQEEILVFLNELGTRITFEYNIVNVLTSTSVSSADIGNEVTTKNMANAVPDILTAVPPGISSPSDTAEVNPAGGTGQTQQVMHNLQRNEATIAISGRYGDLIRVYDAILANPRLIVTDNIQMVRESSNRTEIENPEGENDTWQLNADLIFYSFTGLDNQS